MKEESSFRVYGWMIHKLHLKGNELLCYALIFYYFSIDPKACQLTGTYPSSTCLWYASPFSVEPLAPAGR